MSIPPQRDIDSSMHQVSNPGIESRHDDPVVLKVSDTTSVFAFVVRCKCRRSQLI